MHFIIMKKLIHSLAIFCPLALILLTEAIFSYPASIYWLSPLLLALVAAAVWFLVGRKIKNKILTFYLPPIFLVSSTLLYTIFLQGQTLRRLIVILGGIVLAVFFENIYTYHFSQEKYQRYSLSNFSSYFNLIVIFLLNASLFSLIIFLQFPLWGAILINVIVTLLLAYQNLTVSRIEFIRSWPYILAISVISVEIFWAASFLPLSVYNQALILTIAHYLTAGISRNRLLGIFDRKIIIRYAVICLFCLLAILITAKYK